MKENRERAAPRQAEVPREELQGGKVRGRGAKPKSHIPEKRHTARPAHYNLDTRRDDDEGECDCASHCGSVTRYHEKSGFLDKPLSQVVHKLKWPHMNQNPRYVTNSLMFNQLNFCQLIGGECRTIMRTSDPIERMGRLRILSKVAYMHDQCRDWEKARGAYFAILCSIEEGEASWDSSFGHYDIMCPPRAEENFTRYEAPTRKPVGFMQS